MFSHSCQNCQQEKKFLLGVPFSGSIPNRMLPWINQRTGTSREDHEITPAQAIHRDYERKHTQIQVLLSP